MNKTGPNPYGNSPIFSSPFYDKLFKGIQEKRWYPYKSQDFEDFLNLNHFSGESMLPLAVQDEKRLRVYLRNALKDLVSAYRLKEYCLNSMVRLKGGIKKPGDLMQKWAYVVDIDSDNQQWNTQVRTFAERNNILSMTLDEKVDFLKNPLYYSTHRYSKGGSEGDFCRQGYRSLEEYDGLSKGRFADLLDKARKSTGNQKIRLLDIGGGIGQALQDIKMMDENVYTINMIIDPDFSMFTSDRTIIGSAERFPADLLNSVDLIITNMAFRYFPFADLAVRNIIFSLSIGGMADVFVSTERSRTPERERKKRLTETYSWLRKLESEGYIDVSFTDGYSMSVNISKEDSLYPCRGMKVTKLKEIPLTF